MILAIDTSTQWVGLALHDGVQILAEKVWRSQNYHTVELVPAIERILQQTSTPKAELKAVVVAIGPGSFTGLRIGIAAAKGIGLALGNPSAWDSLPGYTGCWPRRNAAADDRPAAIGRGRFAWARYLYKKGRWYQEGEINVDEPRAIAATIKSPVLLRRNECRKPPGFERKWKTAQLSTGAQESAGRLFWPNWAGKSCGKPIRMRV